MKLQQFELVNKMIERINFIDSSNDALHGLAKVIADGVGPIKLNIKATLLNHPLKKEILDSDGSLIKDEDAEGLDFPIFGFSRRHSKREKKESAIEILEELPDIITIQLIGGLIDAKNKERKRLVEELKKI